MRISFVFMINMTYKGVIVEELEYKLLLDYFKYN